MAASEETKEAVAKAGFVAVWAAIAGPAGILVAALAVGIDRAWNGDAGRQFSNDLDRQRVADQRQWLTEDRAWREQLRADRKRWLDEGAKPEDEPARPSKAEAAGRWWRRLWARMAVGADDFKKGFREGREAAKKARDGGAGWREIVKARPEATADLIECMCDNPRPHGGHEWADNYDSRNRFRCPGVQAGADRPADQDVDDQPTQEPDDGVVDRTCPNSQPHDPHRWGVLGRLLRCPGVTGKAPDRPNPATKPDPSQTTRPNSTEEPMTQTTAPKGTESNVSVLARWLQKITGTVTKVSAGVDDLDRLADALAEQVRQAREFAAHTGQATATNTALDSAMAVVTRLKALCRQASDAAAKAQEDVATAIQSTKPVLRAEDSLNAVGATGEAVAPAKAA